MESSFCPSPRGSLAWRSSPCRWLVAAAVTTTLALADGMVFGYDPRMGRWDLQQEESQLCLINYENGVERMLVSVALSDLRGSKAAWIVPIPSSPDSASIDIVRGFPTLAGTSILARVERVVTRQFTRMSLTQFYPALFLQDPNREAGFGPVYGLSGSDSEEVSVHNRKEEMGLTTELVTAEHPGAIFGYLKEKGVELPDEAQDVLDKYRADSFSFVVTWISDSFAFMGESLTARQYRNLTPAIGISVSFPTQRAYFPLRPTSVYGYTEVPIDVYVIGHMFPSPYRRTRNSAGAIAHVDHFTQRDYRVPKALQTFFNGKKNIRLLNYTRVIIRAPAYRLTRDIWFKPNPPGLAFAKLLNGYQLVWVPLVFLLCSCLASLIAGTIVLRPYRLPPFHQAGFGLWNFLSLAGLAVVTHVTTFRERGSPNISSPAALSRSAGPARKLLFVILFTLIFQAILALFYVGVNALI